MPKFTSKKKRFIEEYAANGFNGVEAWLEIHKDSKKQPSRASASVQASRVLKEPEAEKYLDEILQRALGPNAKRIQENVKFWEGIRDDPMARHADRIKASENIAKYSRMFVEQREVEHSGQVTIKDDL